MYVYIVNIYTYTIYVYMYIYIYIYTYIYVCPLMSALIPEQDTNAQAPSTLQVP